MITAIRSLAALVVLASAVVLTAPSESAAQGRDSLLNALRDDALRQELGLTEEQQAKFDELQNRRVSGDDLFRQYADRLRSAETEEQRDAVRAEMDAAGDKAREEAEAAARELLTSEQHDKLAGHLIRTRGARALMNPAVRSSLGMTDEQAAKLVELEQQRQNAARQLGPGTSQEQFRAFTEEWSSKPLTVLNADQRAKWDAAIAPPQAAAEPDEAAPERSTPPAVAEETPDTATPPATADAMPVEEPPADDPAYESEDDDGPIVSFGTSGEGSRAADDQEQRTLSFNFRYAPWSEVLRLFADYSNLTLDLNQVPPGTFNYYDDRKYTPTEALDVLNGYLLQKGYILVRRDNFLVCLNIDDGIPPNLVPNITPDELPKRGQNELLNVVFPIEGVSATDVAREVELLLGPQGKVVPLATSNSLVVTDIGSNLRRIDRLLDAVAAAGPGDMVFKPYTLTHLDPRDAEAIVKTQLGLEAGIRSVSSAYEDWRRDRDRDDDRDSRSRSSNQNQAASATTPRVSADERTGGLLVTATAAQHRIVEEVLKATDVPSAADDRARARSDEPYLEVYRLHRSDPQEVVKTLDVLMPGVVVNEDGRARKIHVHAPAAVQDEVARLIRQLDGEGSGTGSTMTVIPLVSKDPYAVATVIRSLFMNEDDDEQPMVEADSYGRQLLVRGTEDQIAQIRAMLTQMGEDGAGNGRGNYSSGPVRTIPLGGRDPEEMLPLLQKLWETSGDQPLRIVPTAPGSIIERRPLGDAEAVNDSGPAANFNVLDPVTLVSEPPDAPQDATPAPETAPKPEAASSDAAEPSSEAEPADAAADQPQPSTGDGKNDASEQPVAVTVQGGNLVIASEDEEALNRLEDLIQRLGQVIPPRTKWSVFYLRSADATETAMLLEQLFPTSSVSTASLDSGLFGGLTSGLSSFGGGLMDAAGLDSLGVNTQSLRIIPDVRSNSLFVSGPPDKVAEVEQVLNVLDTNELPDSLRDRVPRMIEVKYADVNEVAGILREVYKDYLQPANMAAMSGNPLAMLLAAGGGGRGDRDRRDEPAGAIRLTIGVDAQTSRLIVSADEALFRQIEELVASIDESARQAKRTVKVISLENANAAMLQATLGSLIPKVRTSSTADRRSSSSTNNGGNGSFNRDDDDDGDRRGGDSGRSQEEQERIRQFFEDRMRERMRQGGGDRGGDFRRSFGRGR